MTQLQSSHRSSAGGGDGGEIANDDPDCGGGTSGGCTDTGCNGCRESSSTGGGTSGGIGGDGDDGGNIAGGNDCVGMSLVGTGLPGSGEIAGGKIAGGDFLGGGCCVGGIGCCNGCDGKDGGGVFSLHNTRVFNEQLCLRSDSITSLAFAGVNTLTYFR